MKVLHLANFFHPESGGIKTYLDNKRRFFAARGLPFRLVIPDERDSIEHSQPDEVVYRIASPRAPMNSIYRMIINLGVVHKIVKRENPDLLEVNDKFTLMALSYFYRKIQKRLPTAGFHHERFDVNVGLYLSGSSLARKFAHYYMRVFSAAFDRIFCNSRFTAGEIDAISPEKIEVIHLGIDLERFSAGKTDESVRNQYSDGADLLLLYVGRLAKEKNIHLLPEVMNNLRSKGVRARLVIAGVGEESEAVRKGGAGDIILAGYITDREHLARLYAIADAFVFPSKSEPYGLAPLEALASGLPVVCPDSGGVLEYSDSEAVRSVKPTAEVFAQAILEFANEDREKLRRLARKQAERFPWERTFERQLEIYEEMVRIGVTRPSRR